MRVFFPSKLSSEQIDKLNDEGIVAIAIPLIKTVPLPFSVEEIENFQPDFVVFSSKNGVKHFLSKIPIDYLKTARVIAVGKSTAKLLKSEGIEPLVPQTFSGEGLVELVKTMEIKGKKFLLIKPKVARKVFSEFLKQTGNEVKEIIAYETIVNEEVKEDLIREIEKGIDIFTFTSPSTFKSFLKLSEDKGEKALSKSKIIPIGHVTANAIEKANFKVWKIPEEYTLNGIINTIIEYGGKK
ncbi:MULTISPECIES: uroporphyrinogen-III synthase [unclassified Desulfurobacterium]|uniref:uroporphyrinogen-III synthase n=1 Tax=Desulfurobacterium sp. TC5-1 TaxID=1158318 RepID=UPI0003B66924|nr:uroporphyrinogen-III synthase [Desulfurobacterium sp. TC5-1]